MRRAIKLVFREQRVSCPHCHAELIYNSLSKTIRLADRTYLKCGKGLVIENNIGKRLPGKKRPQKA